MTARDATLPVLEMRGISKRFGRTQALADVDLMVRPGTVHALLGENGAGKTTLMHIAFGTLAPDAGTIGGSPAPSSTAGRTPRPGVGMVHQHLSLIPSLTGAENFELGGRGRLRPADAGRRLEELGRVSGLMVPPLLRAREMSIVEQQRLEILKALGREASLLIMDEPTALLAPAEVRALLAWIRRFVDGGGSLVLVTHKLREALSVADDITVLRRGRLVWHGPAASATEAELARAIFPERETGIASLPAASDQRGDLRVRARELLLRRDRGTVAIDRATFDIDGGEVVGVAAVEGAGHAELLAALAGLRSPAGGELTLPGRIAFIPADRQRDAIIPGFSLTENVALRGAGTRRGRMPWAQLASRTQSLIARFAIAADSPHARTGSLSGGNQQRLVVARELERDVDLVVAENPTRGLDMQASAFVHEQLRAAAARGAAVVVHSSDVDELLALATRMLVVFHGRLMEVPRDRETVGRAMLGAA